MGIPWTSDLSLLPLAEFDATDILQRLQDSRSPAPAAVLGICKAFVTAEAVPRS